MTLPDLARALVNAIAGIMSAPDIRDRYAVDIRVRELKQDIKAAKVVFAWEQQIDPAKESEVALITDRAGYTKGAYERVKNEQEGRKA